MNETKTAYVLGNEADSEIAATALRASGYRAVNPHEVDAMAGLDREDRVACAKRDMLASLDCDLIVMVPQAELAPAAVAIVASAGEREIECVMIERLIPSWKKNGGLHPDVEAKLADDDLEARRTR
jgi:hypothetical protein